MEIDDGHAGDFVEFGVPSMVVERSFEAERGLTYRLRYRALNGLGWGEYSDVLEVLAAEPPLRPSAPIYVSSSGTSMALRFEESEDDGGSRIISYELWQSSDY